MKAAAPAMKAVKAKAAAGGNGCGCPTHESHENEAMQAVRAKAAAPAMKAMKAKGCSFGDESYEG